jgi:diadenosine tetraphosphatase ApaH/serine/threonine PP2A family protein phosphatase
VAVDDEIEICHGAPFDEDEYIFDGDDAVQALAVARRPLCLFGHTHVPVVFALRGNRVDVIIPSGAETDDVVLAPGVHYLANVGSVGQPRDGDPRAAFGICNTATRVLHLRRVPYPVGAAQRRILAAGLPASLANRLAIGR